jgi:SAM-dependent methyltransferase
LGLLRIAFPLGLPILASTHSPGEGGALNPTGLFERWQEAQAHWDDDEFLSSLHRLMRLRYARLNDRVARVLESAFAGRIKPLLVYLGCGRGDYWGFLSTRAAAKGWSYLGVEPSAEQLAHRERRDYTLGLIQAAAENPPLCDMCADAVLMKEMLDHCWDPPTVFRETHRLLKPGGVLLVTLTNDRSWFKRFMPGVNRRLKQKQKDHFHFLGPQDLERLALEARFDTVSVDTYNHLKLPRFLEKATDLFGAEAQNALLAATDSFGRRIGPLSGGGMMLAARRPLEQK